MLENSNGLIKILNQTHSKFKLYITSLAELLIQHRIFCLVLQVQEKLKLWLKRYHKYTCITRKVVSWFVQHLMQQQMSWRCELFKTFPIPVGIIIKCIEFIPAHTSQKFQFQKYCETVLILI